MMYQEATISPSHSGFGEWICNRYGLGEPWDPYAWIAEVEGQGLECFILGRDALPEDIEDIRGRIHSEPAIVLAVRDEEGHISYRGMIPA
jgi:hypothetical protein